MSGFLTIISPPPPPRHPTWKDVEKMRNKGAFSTRNFVSSTLALTIMSIESLPESLFEIFSTRMYFFWPQGRNHHPTSWTPTLSLNATYMYEISKNIIISNWNSSPSLNYILKPKKYFHLIRLTPYSPLSTQKHPHHLRIPDSMTHLSLFLKLARKSAHTWRICKNSIARFR